MKVYEASAEHTHTAILLHGRDSVAAEFAAEFFESQASDERTLPEIWPNVKWVFPAAGMLRSARFGCALSQWFDMHSTEDPHEQEDAQDMAQSIRRVREVVAEEAALVSGGARKVLLGGISQGCAVAVHALLGGDVRLAGLIGLCSWMPRARAVSAREKSSSAIDTPVLLCHAQDDEVIDVRFGRELRETLESIGMDVRWREYAAGGHWVNVPHGVDDMVAFMRTIGFAEQ
nr:acyl-protein thioesterase 1 [Quercus suber]